MNIEFGFLTSLSYLMDLSNDSNIVMKIHHLTEVYDDIIASAIQREIHHLRRHIKIYEETTGKETAEWKAHEILKYVMNWGFEESFPNLPITLRTFLTMCV